MKKKKHSARIGVIQEIECAASPRKVKFKREIVDTALPIKTLSSDPSHLCCPIEEGPRAKRTLTLHSHH